MDKNFRPILGKGEKYIFPHENRPGLPIKDKRPEYEEARDNLIQEIDNVKNQMIDIAPKYKVEEVVVNLRMALGYTAKSYHPNNLIRLSGIKDIGSKKWVKKEKVNDKVKTQHGKDIFLRFSEQELSYLESLLHQSESNLSKGFKDDVRTIEQMYINNNSHLLDIFSSDWDSGRVEIVLHPFGELEKHVEHKFMELFIKSGGNSEEVKIRNYYPGPTFVSLSIKRPTLEEIIKFNPIRTAHPMELKGVTGIRSEVPTNPIPLPKPPKIKVKSSVTVGIFDGGIDEGSLLLKDYVNENHLISTSPDVDFIQHGTSVAGAALYGDLKKYNDDNPLPVPSINVESFRVLPPTNSSDFDLYEVIDIIEKVVPKRKDIKVFNLSLGPFGPISDDYISRFTYVIDSLSQHGERLFVVAVGNTGNEPDEGLRRIQAPSDTINGIGVGAYTFNQQSEIIRAPYSSVGEGREGAKVKPDIVDYGGCDINPFHLIGAFQESTIPDNGTSYAAPIVSRKAAELIGRCNIVDPLSAKALLVNSALHPKGQFDRYLGYGVLPESVDDIMQCSSNRVTVLYRQRILPKKFARLEIPLLRDLNYKGKVDITWTIAIACKPNSLNTEDYTTNCIEDFFYPNSNTYKYKSPTGKPEWRKNTIVHKEEIENLLAQGWKKSKYPVTESGSNYLNEQERRANFKWDTIVKKGISMSYKKLDSPYLVIHAMDRYVEDSNSDFFNYAVAVTINYRDYKDDAYKQTIENYNQLEVAEIRNQNELLVK